MTSTASPPERPKRGIARLHREMIVPRSLDETFVFFSDAHNLDRLTPPWVGFRILTPRPIRMGAGSILDYSLRVHGIPIRWRTEITVWEPPHRFVDVQARGPYRWWEHTHRFEACAEGTRMIDDVEYVAPLWWISHPLMVNRDVARIFDYRTEALARVFGRTLA
jgi:ligand-binding SRPBCC domain-containing protein